MSSEPQFSMKFPAATAEQAAALEQRIGAPLPPQYREYMLTNGGGHLPDRGYFKVQWPRGYQGFSSNPWVWFTWFLKLERGDGSVYDTLETAWADEFGWPKNLLPIAQSDAGGIVFVGIAGPQRDKVFFGYTNDTTDESGWDNVAVVADSFQQWLQGLIHEDQVPTG